MGSIYRMLLFVFFLFICSRDILAQHRISFSIDHAIGWADDDFYSSFPSTNFQKRLFPSFTLTKHIKDHKSFVVQMFINPDYKESIAVLYQNKWKSKPLYNYQIGLHFEISSYSLVNLRTLKGGYFSRKREHFIRPSLALGVSREFDFLNRYFVRCQALGLGKIGYSAKRFGFGGAVLFSVGVGVRLGKTDRAFPKQDDMDDH